MKKIIFVLLIGLSFGILSCEEEKLPPYDGISRINLYHSIIDEHSALGKRDSLEVTFAVLPEEEHSMEVTIKAGIMGLVSPEERKIELEAVDSLTTVSADYYELVGGVLAANANVATLKIILKRVPGMGEAYERLVVKVKDNGIFAPGVKEREMFKIKWNDALMRPSWWGSGYNPAHAQFGTWSTVKHQFILDATGISVDEFANANTIGGYIDYLFGKAKEALENYNSDPANAGHPLMDGDAPMEFAR